MTYIQQKLCRYEQYFFKTYLRPTYIIKRQARLCWRDEGDSPRYIYTGTKKEALRAAYIHLLGVEGKLPGNAYSGNPRDNEMTIDAYATGRKVPQWFEEAGLPELNISEQLKKDSKAQKKQEKDNKSRLAQRRQALENAIPFASLEQALASGNRVEGYSISKRVDGEAELYSRDANGSRYLGLFKTREALIIAYFLIMNRRGTELPEYYGADYSAKYEFIKFAKGEAVPAWFDENDGLPRLEL